MRPLNVEELAALLHETQWTDEELIEIGREPRCTWGEEAEFNRDDYRRWAERILQRARVALKPE